jgi:lipid-A-disaccharide synthase
MSTRTIWVVAGETSGDARAAELMKALQAMAPDIAFVGAGGPRMATMSRVPFDNWIATAGVVGLWDVLKRYGYFRDKFHRMLSAIGETQPAAVILVDYPGFNLRMAKALRARYPKLRIIYYVSPQVWAWNRRRIPKMAKWLDLMLCIFPFEKVLYEKSGLRTEFVGHPIVEQFAGRLIAPPERTANLIGLFPGSREREVKRIFPAMAQAAARIAQSRPETVFEAAAASPAHVAMMQSSASEAGVAITIQTGTAHDLMQRAAAGLVCSGTATLEAACLGLPYALIYKTAWLTYEVGRRLVTVDHLGIVNILAGRTVVREFIQDGATPAALADEILRLLNVPNAAARLSTELQSIVAGLGGEGAAHRAALAVVDLLGQTPRSRL